MELMVEIVVTGDEEISYEVGDLIEEKKGKRTYSRPVFARDISHALDILKGTLDGIHGLKTVKIKNLDNFRK